MMLLIIRSHAFFHYRNIIIVLIGIDHCHPDTGMRVNACDYNMAYAGSAQELVKGGTEKGAVTFLNDKIICTTNN